MSPRASVPYQHVCEGPRLSLYSLKKCQNRSQNRNQLKLDYMNSLQQGASPKTPYTNMFARSFLAHMRHESHISEHHLPGSMTQMIYSSEFSASTNLHTIPLETNPDQGYPRDVNFTTDESTDQVAFARMKELQILESIYLCGSSESKRKSKSKDRKSGTMVEIIFASPTSGV